MTTPPTKRRRAETTAAELPPVPHAHFEEQYLRRPLPPQPEIVGAAQLRSADAMDQFEREGFLVVRGLLDAQSVEASRDRLNEIADAWKTGVRPGLGGKDEAPGTPLVDQDPDFTSGRLKMPDDFIDSIRRFFRIAVHDDHFRDLTTSPALVGPLNRLWGSDVSLLQSMALLKPPGTGEKRWHADQGYFRLAPSPSKVAAFWIALDPCDQQNGCMFVAPRSHLAGTPQHAVPAVGVDGRTMKDHPNAHIFYSAAQKPDPDNVFAVPMEPGDALLFHGDLLHFSPPNRTTKRRRGLQFHYAATECRPNTCAFTSKTVADGKNEVAKTVTVVKAPNPVFGPLQPKENEQGGFDCAPPDGICIEPQYWYYRKAELIASGKSHGPGHI